MKRTPLKRGAPLKRSTKPLVRKTKLRPVSKRRAREAAKRALLVGEVLLEHPLCQAGVRLASKLETHRCLGRSSDVHEVHTRGRGGDFLDPSNVLAVCRSCHDAIHTHPVLALELGLLASGVGREAR